MEGKYAMQENKVMTAQELAEARELESKMTAGPWLAIPIEVGEGETLSGYLITSAELLAAIPEPLYIGNVAKRSFVTIAGQDPEDAANANLIAAARTLVPRLLDAHDALTERAERAEAELSRMCRESMAYKQERDEALALADARGRALDNVITFAKWHLSPEQLKQAKESLSITAPEALRQQQEREAEMVAIVRIYQQTIQALSLVQEGRDSSVDTRRTLIDKALSITPPQALAQQREYVGALEKVVEAARDFKFHNDRRVTIAGFNWAPIKRAIWDALDALDAVKGGV